MLTQITSNENHSDIINSERLIALKCKYQKPILVEISIDDKNISGCSDMASGYAYMCSAKCDSTMIASYPFLSE